MEAFWTLIFCLLIGWWLYRSGKRIGSIKGFRVGLDRPLAAGRCRYDTAARAPGPFF